MKPCAANRQHIVWLKLNALEARAAAQLRAHLETCEGCRRYLAEISHVADRLSAPGTNPDIYATESFHRKVAGKLRTAKPDRLVEILRTWLGGGPWNIGRAWPALPVIAGLGLAGILVANWPKPACVALRPPAGRQIVLSADAEEDLASTMANYQRVANQSLEKLDALLTRQAKRALPPMPVSTASTLTLQSAYQ
jgi:anti-sigma factor RsiW